MWGELNITKKIGKTEDIIEQVFMHVFDTLVEGALSMKLTELTSNTVGLRLNEESDQTEQFNNMAILFTLPNGISTAEPKSIIGDWLVPELAKKLKTMRVFEPYQ